MINYIKVIKMPFTKKVDLEGKKNSELHLSINSLLTNPAGSGTANVASRKLIIASLNQNYEKLIAKHKKFNYNIFRYDKKIVFHIKIPTESLDFSDLLYDVIIEVDPKDETNYIGIANQPTKVFSNSPSFSFTYAYVLNKRDEIPGWVKDKKINKIFQTEEPKVKNPVETFGFEKTIYFACKFIKENNLYLMKNINLEAKEFKEKLILANIPDLNLKLKEYNIEKKKVVLDRKKKKKKEKAVEQTVSKMKEIKTIGKIGGINTITSIKKTKRIKSIKKIGKK